MKRTYTLIYSTASRYYCEAVRFTHTTLNNADANIQMTQNKAAALRLRFKVHSAISIILSRQPSASCFVQSFNVRTAHRSKSAQTINAASRTPNVRQGEKKIVIDMLILDCFFSHTCETGKF